MRDRDYYPAMSQSQWESAPFNEVSVPDKDFDVLCTQTLSKSVTVTTDNYIPGGYGVDEDGCYQDPDDTSDTNWEEEYHDNDYHTPIQLIELFGEFLKQQKGQGIVFKSPRYTDHLIEECKDWCEDETEIMEDC